MLIFGKRLSGYVAFSKPFLGLIVVAGIARLALSLGGAPNSIAKWLSITAMIGITSLVVNKLSATTAKLRKE
jgi:hypothetical protein